MKKAGIISVFVIVVLAGLTLITSHSFISPPGKMVDVGGFRIHLNCVGERQEGKPTVILLSGAMGYSVDWGGRPDQIALGYGTRVCTIDRAGLGWSERSDQPRKLQIITDEIYRALSNAQERPPYALVSHSWGVLTFFQFAHDHSAEVWPRGLILDPMVAEALPSVFRQSSPDAAEIFDQAASQMDLLIPLCKSGLVKLMGLHSVVYPSLPPDMQPAANQNFSNCDNLQTIIDENQALDSHLADFAALKFDQFPVQFEILQSDYAFSDDFRPLFGERFPYDAYNLAAHNGQERLCREMQPACVSINIVAGAGHYVQLTNPKDVLHEIGFLFTAPTTP